MLTFTESRAFAILADIIRTRITDHCTVQMNMSCNRDWNKDSAGTHYITFRDLNMKQDRQNFTNSSTRALLRYITTQ